MGAYSVQTELETVEIGDDPPLAKPMRWSNDSAGLWGIITSGATKNPKANKPTRPVEASYDGNGVKSLEDDAVLVPQEPAPYHHIPGKVKGYPIKRFRPNPHPFDSE